MAKRPIITAPDKRLKARSAHVDVVDDEVRALLDDMLETMYASDGIGLAAIQVGEPRRCIVSDVHMGGRAAGTAQACQSRDRMALGRAREPRGRLPLLPRTLCGSGAAGVGDGGLPNETGASQELTAVGTLAVCLQHEIDHLEGVLFVDYLSLVKRSIILRKLTKARRTAAGA